MEPQMAHHPLMNNSDKEQARDCVQYMAHQLSAIAVLAQVICVRCKQSRLHECFVHVTSRYCAVSCSQNWNQMRHFFDLYFFQSSNAAR